MCQRKIWQTEVTLRDPQGKAETLLVAAVVACAHCVCAHCVCVLVVVLVAGL
jgi:hypothetical protein